MTPGTVVEQLAVAAGVILVTFVLCWVIVNALFRVEAVVHLAAGRLRCMLGRHGWITVSHASIGEGWISTSRSNIVGDWQPLYRYRVCGTCRRREDLPLRDG